GLSSGGKNATAKTRSEKTMTTGQLTTTTLADKIAALNDDLAGQVPAEVLATFGREIEALARSGIGSSGLREGTLAPDFTLPDVHSRAVTLSALLQQRPVVLTFYRGEWCPYCNLQLRAYEAILSQIRELGASL